MIPAHSDAEQKQGTELGALHAVTSVASAVLFIVVSFATHQSHADSWAIRPLVRIEQSYEDNVGLRSDFEEGSAATRLTGSADIQHSTDRSTTRANVTVNLKRFWNDVYTNDDNWNFTLDSAVRGERSELGVRGWIVRDNSITTRRTITEPVGPGLNPNVDPDEGLVQDKIKRWRFNVRPSWQYAIDEITSTRLRVTYSNVDYEDNDRGLRDFNVLGMVGTLERSLTERTNLSLNADVGRFKTKDGDNTTKNVSLYGDFRHQFSETLRAVVRLGWRWTDVDTPGDSGSDDGRETGLELTKVTERSSFRGQIKQTLVPSGRGDVRRQERLQLDFQHELKPRWSFSLRGTALQQKTLKSETNSNKRKFLSLEPRIAWNVTEWWVLGASYRYEWVDRQNDDNTATNNTVFVNLTYSKPIPLF